MLRMYFNKIWCRYVVVSNSIDLSKGYHRVSSELELPGQDLFIALFMVAKPKKLLVLS